MYTKFLNHKVMKQSISALLVFLGVLNFTIAQDFDNSKVQEMRVKFYNENLQFSEQEQKDFWPLFEQFKKDEQRIKREARPNQRFDLMSDAQAEAYILKTLDTEEKIINLKRDHIKKLMTVIPVRKVAMINRVERQFKKEILNKMRKNRQ